MDAISLLSKIFVLPKNSTQSLRDNRYGILDTIYTKRCTFYASFIY